MVGAASAAMLPAMLPCGERAHKALQAASVEQRRRVVNGRARRKPTSPAHFKRDKSAPTGWRGGCSLPSALSIRVCALWPRRAAE